MAIHPFTYPLHLPASTGAVRGAHFSPNRAGASL